jgi:Flp pilus assembly protein TadG
MRVFLSRPRRLPARLRRTGTGCGDAGASVIELAILAPMLLVLVWLTIQYAVYYQSRDVALAAAQLAVRAASQDETTVPGWRIVAQQDAESYYAGLGTRVLGKRIDADAYMPAPGQVRVTVTGQAASILLGLTLTIHETAGAPVECFRPDVDGGQDCAATVGGPAG